MSYDLSLVWPRGGESVQEAFWRLQESDEQQTPDPAPFDPAAEQRKRDIAQTICDMLPAMARSDVAHRQFAVSQEPSTPSAARQDSLIELNEEPEPTTGLQVAVHDEHIELTLPYWHTGDAAAQIFASIGKVCETVVRRWSAAIYDPQLDRPVTLPHDLDQMRDIYERTVRATQERVSRASETTGAPARPVPRPWWRFWGK